jgi:type IV pilus assembly protein PilV
MLLNRRYKGPSGKRSLRQRGLSLIESLIALLVLSIGILGLAGVQARLLVEGRTANSRATAVGLVDDLANRILLNRDSAIAGNYTLAWGATKAVQDCATAQCSGSQLAQSDLNLWRAALTTALPGGDASVFQSATDTRQIGIAVAWTANESKAADADSAAYNSPFAVTAALNGIACPANLICHVVYVQP